MAKQDFSHHLLRLNRQRDARFRRAMERFKDEVDALFRRIEDIEGGSPPGVNVDVTFYDISTGTATHNISPPTADGQMARHIINTDNSPTGGKIKLKFNAGGDPKVVWPDGAGGSAPSTHSSATATLAGAGLSLYAGKISGTRRWFILNTGSWFPL